MKRFIIPAAAAAVAFLAVAAFTPLQPPSSPQHQAALDDPTIVAIFDAANTLDIATGELASKRGHDPKVRALGAQMAHDHSVVRQQGRDLARKLGVTATPPAGDKSAAEHAAVLKMLSSKHGADFDKAYLNQEVEFHTAVIKAVTTTLLPAIQNAELKAFVEKVAPAFEGHLLAAQNLQKQLGY